MTEIVYKSSMFLSNRYWVKKLSLSFKTFLLNMYASDYYAYVYEVFSFNLCD